MSLKRLSQADSEDVDIKAVAEQFGLPYDDTLRWHQEYVKNAKKNNRLSKDGLRKLMKICFPNRDIDKIRKHIFKMFDTNADEGISFRYCTSKGWLCGVQMLVVVLQHFYSNDFISVSL